MNLRVRSTHGQPGCGRGCICGDMLGPVPAADQMPKLRMYMYAPRLARNFLRNTAHAI